jgi:AcrR family transcriptional regulator
MTSAGRVRRRLATSDRRAEILAASLAALSRQSAATVSVEDVAAACGASPALVHHYFGTKQDLVDATLRAAADELIGRLVVDATAPALEQLRVGLTVYLDYVEAHPVAWTALLRAGQPGDDVAAEIAAQVDDHALRLCVRAVHRRRSRPPAALVAAMRGWIALVKSVCLDWIEGRGLDRGEVDRLLTTAFVGCLQAAASTDPAASAALATLA